MEEDNAKGIIPVALYVELFILWSKQIFSCWGMAWSASLGEMWGQEVAYSVVAIKVKQIVNKNVRFSYFV